MKTREMLRTCQVTYDGRDGEKDTVIEGYFHCWSWSKNKHGKHVLLAVIETKDGRCNTYLAINFIFTDIEGQ